MMSPVAAGLRALIMLAATSTAAIMPGMMMMNGMNIFGNDADDRRAPRRGDRVLEAIARCTSTKFVVQ